MYYLILIYLLIGLIIMWWFNHMAVKADWESEPESEMIPYAMLMAAVMFLWPVALVFLIKSIIKGEN